MANTTKTYLQLVNDTIDEAGESLASFRADGSDFNTNTDAMMNRFKKWVQRSWLDIQEDANDWHWLDSQAVVNITPGIMFYSDRPIGFGTALINPAKIVDVDDSTLVSGLEVSTVQALENQGSDHSKSFGYMDLMYADYTYSNQHALDFGLKAGGAKITKDSDKPQFIATFNTSTAATDMLRIAVGDSVTSVDVIDVANIASTNFVLTNATVVSTTVDTNISSIQVIADAIPDAMWDQFFTYAAAQGFENTFSLAFNIHVTTATGVVQLTGSITIPNPSPSLPVSLPNASISPLNYTVAFTSAGIANNDDASTEIKTVKFSYNNGGKFIEYSVPVVIDRTFLYVDPNGNDSLTLSVEWDSCTSTTGAGTGSPPTNPATVTGTSPMSLFTMLIMTNAPAYTYNIGSLRFYNEDNTDNVYLTNPTGTTNVYTYPYAYLINNWIHSWKSFDWDEETGRDDFVENVRNIHYNSFRLIPHEDPSPPSERPLTYVPWGSFQNKYDFASSIPSKPRMISQDPTGRWRFYPPVDRPYTIKFDYIRKSQKLENYSDIPQGIPDEYVDMIMWKALAYYGEYDEQPAVAARANKNYKNILYTIQQELRNPFSFKPARLY